MTELLHITEAATWRQAQADGRFTASTKGATLDEVGFVHTSLRHQLRRVAEYLYSDSADELVVLVIDGDRVEAPVVVEPGNPDDVDSEQFPHVYGPIPLAAVVEVVAVSRDGDGRFVLPE